MRLCPSFDPAAKFFNLVKGKKEIVRRKHPKQKLIDATIVLFGNAVTKIKNFPRFLPRAHAFVEGFDEFFCDDFVYFHSLNISEFFFLSTFKFH